MTMRQYFVITSIASLAVLLIVAIFWPPILWVLLLWAFLTVVGVIDMHQQSHTIRRLYPVLGHFRYMLEHIRPEIQQYFVESEIDGMPIPREFRSLIYQRAKGARDTRPFGTIFDINRPGYEWVNHSLVVKHLPTSHPRVKFGGDDCLLPYMASPLNISAMSYGALSKNAIMALNKGAKIGGFAHNTGEGGLSPYHIEHGGDIIWQIGTGYFGCRDLKGNFSPELFQKTATKDVVKMIEIKLSQGAKPGHGGMLPGAKVNAEVAEIRNVEEGKDVLSPATHSTFSTPVGLLQFVQQLRDLSGGKPIGFKLCIGRKDEFLGICKAMVETKILPDFITIDGGEGGTGAAPIEMTNSVGTPIRDALVFVDRALIGVGLRDKIRLIASGKMFSAFHILRALALGADTVNSARGMMLALGCIQSRSCNTDHCPTGIATQNPSRNKGLVVTDKSQRVANFHAETIKNLIELVGAAGLDSLEDLGPKHINRRIQGSEVKTYGQLYPKLDSGCLLAAETRPKDWVEDWEASSAAAW
jgi:hypothetical protein